MYPSSQRARPRGRAARRVALAAVALLTAASPAAAATTWTQSGQDGGGFMSTIAVGAVHGAQPPTLVAGGDTQGLFRSIDGGSHWVPASLLAADASTVFTGDERRTASIYHVTGDRWLAAVGNASAQGTSELLTSTNDGASWTSAYTLGVDTPGPDFEGANGFVKSGGFQHPRSTGTLIAHGNGKLFVGSYDGGVYRCDWNPTVSVKCAGWKRLWFGTADDVRGLAYDPVGDRLFVARSNGASSASAVMIEGASGESSTSASLPETNGTQELEFVETGGSKVLLTVGPYGLRKFSWTGAGTPSNTGSWSAPDTTSPALILDALDAYWDGSKLRIVAAGCDDSTGTAGRATVGLTATRDASPVGGVPGAPSVTGARIDSSAEYDNTVYGSGQPWWIGTDEQIQVGQKNFLGSQVAFMRTSTAAVPTAVYIAGRSSIYRRNWNASLGVTGSWKPAPRGLNVTFVTDVRAEGNALAFGDADWKWMTSIDGGATVQHDEVTTPTPTPAPIVAAPAPPADDLGGTTLAISHTGSAYLLGAGNQGGNAGGQLWFRSTFQGGSTWDKVQAYAAAATISGTSRVARPVALVALPAITGVRGIAVVIVTEEQGVVICNGETPTDATCRASTLADVAPTDITSGASLSWTASNDDAWIYLPRSKQVVRVAAGAASVQSGKSAAASVASTVALDRAAKSWTASVPVVGKANQLIVATPTQTGRISVGASAVALEETRGQGGPLTIFGSKLYQVTGSDSAPAPERLPIPPVTASLRLNAAWQPLNPRGFAALASRPVAVAVAVSGANTLMHVGTSGNSLVTGTITP